LFELEKILDFTAVLHKTFTRRNRVINREKARCFAVSIHSVLHLDPMFAIYSTSTPEIDRRKIYPKHKIIARVVNFLLRMLHV